MNLYEYCGDDPVNGVDPSGDVSAGDVGQFLLGATDAINPIKIAHGLAQLPGLAVGMATGRISPTGVGQSLFQGVEFWSAPNARVAGQRFTGDALMFAGGVGAVTKLRALAAAGADLSEAAAAGGGAGSAVNEGVYVVTRANGDVYVGQSGNITERLVQHVASGKVTSSEVANAQRFAVGGGKTAREIAEQTKLDSYGGVRSLRTVNIRNPIGARRISLMGPGYVRP